MNEERNADVRFWINHKDGVRKKTLSILHRFLGDRL